MEQNKVALKNMTEDELSRKWIFKNISKYSRYRWFLYSKIRKSKVVINMEQNKVALKNMTEDELKDFIVSIGEKSFRGTQIFSWIYKGAKTFDDMRNIPKNLRKKLDEVSYIGNIEQELKLESKVDKTKKYLFLLNDGNIIETVMMDYEDRVTVCISNQVGCRMGCNFCASTLEGLIRNLEPWEILDQIMKIQEDTGKRVSNLVLMGSGEPLDNFENTKKFLKLVNEKNGLNIGYRHITLSTCGKRVSNLVLMGSGEPLDNFENTKKFLKLVNEKNGLNIGYRHITLSTCGLVPKMYELADLGLPINLAPINLALSLHSPFDEKRREIMPVANAYKVNDLIDACKYYIKKTNRRVTFEYSLIKGVNDSEKEAKEIVKLLKGSLIKGVNDSEKEAKEIVKLLKGMLCHVNLIPINKVEEREYERPDKSYIYKFRDYLEKNNIPATVRISMGSDIGGACGQLRRKHK